MTASSKRSSYLLGMAASLSHLLPESIRLSVYRLSVLSRVIRSALNVVAPDGLTEVAVAAGPLRGSRLLLNLKSEKYYWLGNYEPMLTKAIHEFVRPGMIVYDLGANIGYVTLILAQSVGTIGRIFAFEPLPANIERLRFNIALNNKNDLVHLVTMAVCDVGGYVKFLSHKSHGMGKLSGVHGRDEAYAAELDVPAVRLDDFVYRELNPPPDLIKMDIEGGGEKAIPGMERVLSKARPICLLELHGPEEGHVAWQFLRQHKYAIRRMAPGWPRVQAEGDLAWKEYIVGVPDD
jgi:FkbM family methyltransferase